MIRSLLETHCLELTTKTPPTAKVFDGRGATCQRAPLRTLSEPCDNRSGQKHSGRARGIIGDPCDRLHDSVVGL